MRTDELLHITLMQGQARVLLCDTTEMAEKARQIHEASRVCTAALGRGISAAAMLGSMLKGGRLTLTFKGDGPAGALVMVARPGFVKATIDEPRVELPLRPNGKLDVGGAIGRNGRVTVVKDLGLKEPYVGQCRLASGEIAEDVALYCTTSEQQPTLCSLGVLVGERVLASGGLLIQPLPGCPEETIVELEKRVPLYSDISGLIREQSPEALIPPLFDGLQPKIIAREALEYRCDCSRERMERVLISMGRAELEDMIQEQGGAELTCHFCRNKHQFSASDLRKLMEEMAKKE